MTFDEQFRSLERQVTILIVLVVLASSNNVQASCEYRQENPARLVVAGAMVNPLYLKGSTMVRVMDSWHEVKIGSEFGRLTVIGQPFTCGPSGILVVAECQCGRVKAFHARNIVKNKSCGCKRDGSKRVTHGESRSKLYGVWHGMIRRCQSKKNYAGRGISVCEEWLTYEPFAIWAKSHGYQEGKELDRRNNDGNYNPDNCRFVTRSQNNNKRTSAFVTAFGETKTITEWSRDHRCVVPETCLYWRLRHGWSEEQALTTASGVRV